MNENDLTLLLNHLMTGQVNVKQVITQLKNTFLKTTFLGHAQPDHHRELRHGLNEVIYGQNKTQEQIAQIAHHLAQEKRCVLITRLNQEKLSFLKQSFPEGRANEIALTFMLHTPEILPVDVEEHFVAVISAGTSDINVAEEACEVCIAMKIPVHRIYDVGVSGIHRVMMHLETMQKAAAIIVIAGMEGALPSVIGGLVNVPIIAVPTSVGYGTHFQGITALLGMLNSCAPGLLVTNVDAGFTAGFAAARILNRMKS